MYSRKVTQRYRRQYGGEQYDHDADRGLPAMLLEHSSSSLSVDGFFVRPNRYSRAASREPLIASREPRAASRESLIAERRGHDAGGGSGFARQLGGDPAGVHDGHAIAHAENLWQF